MRRLFPLLGLALFACTPPAVPEPAPAPPMEMRVYDVPAGQKGFIARTVNNAMSAETRQGRALEGPADTVVVVAPASLQTGVAALVDKVGRAAPVEAAVVNVELRYWVVAATPAESPVIPAELQVVGPALADIARVDGPATFELVAQRRIQTMNGRSGAVKTRELSIQQDLAVSHDRSAIQVDLMVSLGRSDTLRTELSLAPDTFAVLAQSQLDGRDVYVIVQPVLK